MGFQAVGLPKMEGVVAGRDGYNLVIGRFQIQVAAKVVIFGLIGDCGTHTKHLHIQFTAEGNIYESAGDQSQTGAGRIDFLTKA